MPMHPISSYGLNPAFTKIWKNTDGHMIQADKKDVKTYHTQALMLLRC